MSRAIITKYLGSTESRGSRIKATIVDYPQSLTIPWNYGEDAWANHLLAAKALAQETGWGGAWLGGTLGDGRWAWVRSDKEYSFRTKKRQLDMFGLAKKRKR